MINISPFIRIVRGPSRKNHGKKNDEIETFSCSEVVCSKKFPKWAFHHPLVLSIYLRTSRCLVTNIVGSLYRVCPCQL